MKDQLLPYAVGEDEYRAFLAARQARKKTTLPVISTIEVRGVPEGEQELIRHELRDNIGRQVEHRRVKEDLLRVTGTDRYECLSYRVAIGPKGPGLLVDVQSKSYGPPFLALSMNASNVGASNFTMDFMGRVTMFDTIGRGSEVRVDAVVGSDTLAAIELYKPVVGRRLFVAPRASLARVPTSLFVDDQWVGEYQATRAAGGIDLGLSLGRRAEARIGYDIGHVTGRVKVGSPELPEAAGTERFASASITFDGQDSPIVPSRGVYAAAVARRYFALPDLVVKQSGASLPLQSFSQAEVGISAFHRAVGQDRVFTIFRGGTSFGDEPLIYDFALGGPFKMGAYASGELRGPSYLYASGGYLKRFARLPDIAGGNVYFGAWLEGGSVFTKLDSARWHGNVSAGPILETLLGPVFLGGGVGFDGRTRLYIAMGPTFR
jgi:NTE family protein